MPKSFYLYLLSALLFACGTYLLLNAERYDLPKSLHIIVDIDESCDEECYLTYGSSSISIEELNAPVVAEDSVGTEPAQAGFLTIMPNQSLHDILKAHQVSDQEIMALTKAFSPHIRAKDLAVGDLYFFKLDNKKIESFTIKKLDPNRLPITYEAKTQNGQINVITKAPPTTEEDAYIQIKIKDTLFKSFQSLEYGNELMQRLMGVFAWRMRMPEKITKEDSVEIVVTKIFAEQKFIGYGRIKSVIYTQPHQTLKAFYFQSKDRIIRGYYDENGVSLEKEMMLAPVSLVTATSNQQLRFHPVIKTRIRHNGIDFRGAIGTDFFSIADGEIIEKRFDKNVGNMIRIKHKNGVHSEYFHADSLVTSLNVGNRVKRGQKIGTIGRTGLLCTGPHLHLGLYLMNGEKRKYIDFRSLEKKLAFMPKLQGAHASEFLGHSSKALSFMEKQKEKLAQN